MSKVTFYHNPYSRGRIVHWMLEECGADYETKILNFKTGEHRRPEFLAINPMGKVPTIVHNSAVVTESAAICAYLADAFPAANLAPAVGSKDRGPYLRWLFFTASSIEPAVTDLKNPRTPPVPRSTLAYGSFDDVMNTLEHAVANGFLNGKSFSAADLYLAANLGWIMQTKQIEPRPIFEDYVKLCQDRPGYRSFMDKTAALEK